MAGEWTVETLKEHTDERFHELVRTMAESRAHDLLAIKKAEDGVGERLARMNQFREQLQSERSTFLDRNYYDAQHEQLEQRVGRVEALQLKLMGALGLVLIVLPVVMVSVGWAINK